MSEENTIKEPDEKGNDDTNLPLEKDEFLMRLVNFANLTDAAISATLFVNGAVITGQIISASVYLQLTSETVGRKFVIDGETPFEQEFLNESEKLREIAKEEGMDAIPSYIHLKDPQIVMNGSIFPQNSPFPWRGKISDVNGFLLGQMQTNN